jgi:hypothetical protein
LELVTVQASESELVQELALAQASAQGLASEPVQELA